MEEVKRWFAVAWGAAVGGARVVNGLAAVVFSLFVIWVVGAIVWQVWLRDVVKPTVKPVVVKPAAVPAVIVPAAVVAPRKADACACSDKARCDGPRGGVYCLNSDGSKRYF